MFKPKGAFSFKTIDGSETVSFTASLGLFYWYIRIVPKLPMPNPMPILEVVQVGNPTPGPYHSKFLMLVISGIERTYGKSPEVPEVMLNKEWYDDIPKTDSHMAVVNLFSEGHPKVVA